MFKKSAFFLILSIVFFTTVFPTTAQDSPPRFEWADIQNLEIPFDSATNGHIQLNQGYARERIGSTFLAPTDFILADRHAFGDVDGDGSEDFVGVLNVDPPGPIQFGYLLIVLNENGEPNVLPLLDLGDREPVHVITIVPGEVGIRNRTHGEGDPPCCPTFETAQRFVYIDNEMRSIERFALYRQVDDNPAVPSAIVDYGLLNGTAFQPATVRFGAGESSISLEGRIANGEVEYFQFFGRAGQHLSLQLTSPNQNVTFALYDPQNQRTLFGGNTFFDPTGISGTLPETQPYILRLVSTTASDTDFRLVIQTITIAP